tara:strand:- start:1101 stop:1658 length:558 start_codon:yes stop_codon:yes gene_type:complete
MRVFISIEFPEEVKKELLQIQKEIDFLGLIKGKFTEQENLHLTLKFLGNLEESELRAVKEKLRSLEGKPFYVELADLGVFSENFIRIVWIGLKGEELFSLQKKIDARLEDIFPKEHRFMAHTTIVRPKIIEDRKMFLEEFKKIKLNKKRFLVDKIYLKESILTSEGAIYKEILEIPMVREEEILA